MSQQSKTTLQSAINTQIADNTSGDISAADIRDNLINITDSLLFNTGSGQSLTGSLNVTEGITGSLLGTATTASYVTGSIYTSTNPALSASYALSSSRTIAANRVLVMGAGGSGTLYPLLGSTSTGDANVNIINSLDYKYNLSTNQLIISSISASSFTGSLSGSATSASYAISASYAPATTTFPFTGSAIISGSLIVTGSITPTDGFTGSLLGTASYATQALSASYAPSSSPYSVYSALLSFSGGTFTVTQLQNTIGDGSNTSPNDIQWSNPSNGLIRATKSGSWSSGTKMMILTTSMKIGTDVYFVTGGTIASVGPPPLQYVANVNIIRHDNDQTSTPNFTNLPIEIRVYN